MVRDFAVEKPVQAGKLVLISLAVIFAIGGFFRIFQFPVFLEGPSLGDPQFIALLVTPLVSLLLVVVISVETVYTVIHVLRADRSFFGAFTSNPWYSLLRLIEAGVAFIGVGLFVVGLRTFVSEPMPAPAGVGLLLAFMVIALSILVVSLMRSVVELYLYSSSRSA